jgi:putative hydrolase of the HAD superfamily
MYVKIKKLVTLFEKLKNLRHILNTNGETNVSLKKLKRIGIAPGTFEKIYCNVDLGILKPDPEAFKIVLRKTRLKPSQHLFVGDSDVKEIIPAKKLGFRTCYVWGQVKICGYQFT